MGGEIFLGLFVVAVVLAIPVSVIVLFVKIAGLKTRLAAIETELRRLRRQATTPNSVPVAPEAETPLDAPVAPEDGTGDRPDPQAQAATPSVAPAPADDPATLSQGPWSAPDTAPVPQAPADGPAQAQVAARTSPLADWLHANWVYVASALSLSLAGVFFVQYGVENGLLPPAARVGAAILFGLGLIAGGEWVRRRWGDAGAAVTAHVPSTLSGAGLVSIFVGVIAARQLYDLIGPETAFAGLLATAALAVVLGWFHGPLLAAVGLVGATAAPFLVGGDSTAPYWLYGYFTLVSGIGLAIDTLRRWAWMSVLALALGFAGCALVLMASGGAGWSALAVVALSALAICLPARSLIPDHQGPTLAQAALGRAGRPGFPTLLAWGASGLATLWLLFLDSQSGAESLMAFLGLAVLALALIVWSERAPALSDLAALPAMAFLLRLGFEGLEHWPLAAEYGAQAIALRAPETAGPVTATVLLGMGLAITIASALASDQGRMWRPAWAAGAAVAAPLATLVLELFWAPSLVIGAFPWALQVIGLAALMAVMAMRWARADGIDMRRTAYAVLSTLSLVALALFLTLTEAALTLALAALIVTAAALDRRFRLPEMGWFIQAAAVVLSWRLVVDPGLEWAIDRAPLWAAVASYAGAAGAAFAALRLLEGLDRRSARVFLESAFAGYAALLANVLILRWLTREGANEAYVFSHWSLALNALPWLITLLAQLHRLQLGGAMRWLRWAIAAVAALMGLGGLALAVTLANPLLDFIGVPDNAVLGPPIADTLLLAYGIPGLLVIAVLTRLGHLHRVLRALLAGIGIGLAGLYAALEIRRLWRGPDLSVPGVTQAELYSYTVALMVVGAGLIYRSLARRSPHLRRAGMGVIGLTIAKVFLIDISGLSGLMRVFSLLALGLALIGLGLLNRWVARRQGQTG